jgi:serine/threonine protein kinase
VLGGELTLILNPAASHGNLQELLQDIQSSYTWINDRLCLKPGPAKGPNPGGSSKWENSLWRAFGCLASGLAFMHDQNIKHKDINPKNILVHKPRVEMWTFTLLYADFGLSYEFTATGNSVTTGPANDYTMRYCAPEVVEQKDHNTKSDVFSLGCVYIEIMAALKPNSVSPMLFEGIFYEKLAALPDQGFLMTGSKHQLVFREMVNAKPAKRPAARGVVNALLEINAKNLSDSFCGNCLARELPKVSTLSLGSQVLILDRRQKQRGQVKSESLPFCMTCRIWNVHGTSWCPQNESTKKCSYHSFSLFFGDNSSTMLFGSFHANATYFV